MYIILYFFFILIPSLSVLLIKYLPGLACPEMPCHSFFLPVYQVLRGDTHPNFGSRACLFSSTMVCKSRSCRNIYPCPHYARPVFVNHTPTLLTRSLTRSLTHVCTCTHAYPHTSPPPPSPAFEKKHSLQVSQPATSTF